MRVSWRSLNFSKLIQSSRTLQLFSICLALIFTLAAKKAEIVVFNGLSALLIICDDALELFGCVLAGHVELRADSARQVLAEAGVVDCLLGLCLPSTGSIICLCRAAISNSCSTFALLLLPVWVVLLSLLVLLEEGEVEADEGAVRNLAPCVVHPDEAHIDDGLAHVSLAG